MLLAQFGSHPKLVDVKLACGFRVDELEVRSFLAVAERFGLSANPLTLRPEQLARESLPMLIQDKGGRYQLLIKGGASGFTLHDPEHGRVTKTLQALTDDWNGLALRLSPNASFNPIKPVTSRSGELLRRLRREKAGLTYVICAGVVTLIPIIVSPMLNELFFDDILTHTQTNWFYPMLSFMAASLVLGSILIFLQQRVLLQTEIRMAISESVTFVDHLLKVPYNFLLNNPAGDTIKRIVLNDAVATLLTRTVSVVVLALLNVGLCALVMIKYNEVLTTVGVTVIVVNFVVLRYVSARRTAMNQALYKKQQRAFSASSDLIQNIETVKAQGWENTAFITWSGYLVSAINENQRLGFTSRILTVMPDFLTQLNSVLIVLVGGALIMKGEISIGVFTAMQSLLASFSRPVKQCVDGGKGFQENVANINNLIEVRELPIDPLCAQGGRESIDQVTPLNARLAGAIEVRDLSFSYNKFAEPLIRDFSISISPGTRIALVGRSGCGKSTLLKVLAGLMPPDAGEILYDGKPIDTINTDVFRANVAMVDQSIFLFTGTVADNIAMWNRSIDQEDIVRAARDATIHDTICEKPGGYESKVENGGSNFSGGQCQRIEIARGLLMRPSVIFLDEATSALDSHTEQQVTENLKGYGCTTLTVAHRLSTIRDYDEILVLDQGKVVQRGSHEELMGEKAGLYYHLAVEA
ncbi:Lactococcin-G-processing and transport ATP-binding protein LagD [Paraburkholderia humisilvae]|uniref:Cyclolysin secretion/processing ATP-binding protein CyaB n=2 Tax=Paraburkholderia humisilvae TaxID=627669 RepID=A0A6J5F7M4_9BURK|nr:Lactococcin-G-processing and transport ATP-binding protein LagD [Paraburkholderia humisilvae]